MITKLTGGNRQVSTQNICWKFHACTNLLLCKDNNSKPFLLHRIFLEYKNASIQVDGCEERVTIKSHFSQSYTSTVLISMLILLSINNTTDRNIDVCYLYKVGNFWIICVNVCTPKDNLFQTRVVFRAQKKLEFQLDLGTSISQIFALSLILMADDFPDYPLGKWDWKGTCPERESSYPGQHFFQALFLSLNIFFLPNLSQKYFIDQKMPTEQPPQKWLYPQHFFCSYTFVSVWIEVRWVWINSLAAQQLTAQLPQQSNILRIL